LFFDIAIQGWWALEIPMVVKATHVFDEWSKNALMGVKMFLKIVVAIVLMVPCAYASPEGLTPEKSSVAGGRATYLVNSSVYAPLSQYALAVQDMESKFHSIYSELHAKAKAIEGGKISNEVSIENILKKGKVSMSSSERIKYSALTSIHFAILLKMYRAVKTKGNFSNIVRAFNVVRKIDGNYYTSPLRTFGLVELQLELVRINRGLFLSGYRDKGRLKGLLRLSVELDGLRSTLASYEKDNVNAPDFIKAIHINELIDEFKESLSKKDYGNAEIISETLLKILPDLEKFSTSSHNVTRGF